MLQLFFLTSKQTNVATLDFLNNSDPLSQSEWTKISEVAP